MAWPQTEENPAINLHCDEFSELMGDEFIPLINKGGGAGVEVTAYTQTLSDIEARIGDRAKADQVVGNFNSRIMMRVRESATVELLTKQLPQVDVLSNSISSGVADSADAQGNISFSSNTQDRMSSIQVPLLEPASLVQLPKGPGVRSAGRWSALEATHPITGRSTRSADAGKHHTHSPLYGKTVRQHAHMVGPPGDSCNGEK